MANKITTKDFFSRVDWEGGLYEYIVEYGCDPQEIEDPELRKLVQLAKVIGEEFQWYEGQIREFEPEYDPNE